MVKMSKFTVAQKPCWYWGTFNNKTMPVRVAAFLKHLKIKSKPAYSFAIKIRLVYFSQVNETSMPYIGDFLKTKLL